MRTRELRLSETSLELVSLRHLIQLMRHGISISVYRKYQAKIG